MLEVCQVLGPASEQLYASQVKFIPIEQFSLYCDSVLASLYFCITDVHQRIVAKLWWSEKQFARLMYKEPKVEEVGCTSRNQTSFGHCPHQHFDCVV